MLYSIYRLKFFDEAISVKEAEIASSILFLKGNRTQTHSLRALKLPERQVHKLVNNRIDYWRMEQGLSCDLTNEIIVQLGYISTLDYYLKVGEN